MIDKLAKEEVFAVELHNFPNISIALMVASLTSLTITTVEEDIGRQVTSHETFHRQTLHWFFTETLI